jgi:hypothetical protein
VQLLGRVFNILRENNPELSAERRRTIMRPPQVLREGTKKTVFDNFMDLCKTYAFTCFLFMHVKIVSRFETLISSSIFPTLRL